MDSRFIFNRPVSGNDFIGRRNNLALLANFLSAGENVVMYEPPKTGKSSLLQQAFRRMRVDSPNYLVVNLSLLNIRTTDELCLRLGSELLKTTGSTAEDFAVLAGDLLSGTHFVFDPRIWQDSGKVLSLNWDIEDNDIEAIFTLPYRLAAMIGKQIFLCLDEFQCIMFNPDGEKLCRKLQEVFKSRTADYRQAACYVFTGSQVNAMKEIFEHHKYFHRQVERVELDILDPREISEYANKIFLMSGKVIDKSLMLGVCKLFRNNIYYINLFCSFCDHLTKGYINEAVLAEALNMVLAVHEPRFKAIMEDLTTFQVGLLRAVVEGHTRFSSAKVIERYSLNSSANVRRLKDALCKKEILCFDSDDDPHFLDPLFEHWLTKYYFEIQE